MATRKLTITLIALFSVSALILAACSAPIANAASLTGTSWTLVSLGPVKSQIPAVADVQTSLAFGADGQVSGTFGCNSFGGKYEIKDGKIVFSEIISTLMACTNEDVMKQEQAGLKILNGEDTYKLEGSTLVIYDASGENALTLSSVPGK